MPTLAAGEALADCLRSLEAQTLTDFEVIVIDNSGVGLARVSGARTRVIGNPRNLGFGAAVNQAYRGSQSPYVAVINDDAVAHPEWLEALLRDAEAHPRAGMFASQVRIAEGGDLDSTGMLIAADGSSKQRGHGQAAGTPFDGRGAVPERVGRAVSPQDAGSRPARSTKASSCIAKIRIWDCGRAGLDGSAATSPGAVVDHRYSHSAGRASPLKAYYVERNRLYTVIKNFPLPHAAARARLGRAGAILLARGLDARRPRESRRVSAAQAIPPRCCRFWFFARILPRCVRLAAAASPAPEDFPIAPDHLREVRAVAAPSLHFVARRWRSYERGQAADPDPGLQRRRRGGRRGHAKSAP